MPRLVRLALLACLALCASAQTSLVNAALDGVVSDTSGGRIAGARVSVRETSTHLERNASSNSEGAFRLAELPVGTYEVTVAQPGFNSYHHAGVALALGATAHLDILLQSAGVTTQVTVTAQPPAIDPAQTSVSTAVDKERIEELPVESRNYLNFALLAPGVSSSAQQPGRRALAPLADSGFTFGGLRARSNNVTIDGLDNNDEYLGASRTELSLETVQEFQVVNSGLSAESGGASGGSINVVTRVGANDIHGDAFLFLENGALDAQDPFETEHATPNRHRYRTGVALGGPLIKDRTFYYAGFEQEHKRSLEDAFIDPAVAAAVNRILGTHRISDNFFPASRAETEASAKVNHRLRSANSLMFRFSYTNNREAGDAFNTLGWDDPSARGSSFTRDYDLAGALTTVFSPHSVGDLRLQFADRDAVTRTNDAIGPGVEIAGLLNFGRPYEGNGSRTERHDQATYTWSYAAGHHLWKAGATFNRIHLDAAEADGFGGLLLFASLADFQAGRPDQTRQAFGTIGTNFAVAGIGGFVEDHWEAAPHLTIDLGVRYDFEKLPGLFNQDTNNVSPRIGIAWHAAPSWMVRAGYGIFYDRYVLAALNRVLQLDGNRGYELVDGIHEAYRAAPGMATPYSQQSSFAVEHMLARDLTATASYLFVRGSKLPRTRLFQLENSASSTYSGATLSLNRRMNNELEFSAGYTLSKTYDDASDFNEWPQDPFNLRGDWSVSRKQQQQRLTFNALWELPIGDEEPGKPPADNWVTKVFGHIELAPIVTAESGRPVNPLTGADTYHTLAYPLSARPLGFGRNSALAPGVVNIDFRALKYFPVGKTAHLDVVAEAFNLLNRPNVAAVNPVFGANFLTPIAGAGARQIQFSLDFEF